MSVALLIEFKSDARPALYVPIATQRAFARIWIPLLLALQARTGAGNGPAIELLLDAETGCSVPLVQVPVLIKVLGEFKEMLETGNFCGQACGGVLLRVTQASAVLRSLNMDDVASIWLG